MYIYQQSHDTNQTKPNQTKPNQTKKWENFEIFKIIKMKISKKNKNVCTNAGIFLLLEEGGRKKNTNNLSVFFPPMDKMGGPNHNLINSINSL